MDKKMVRQYYYLMHSKMSVRRCALSCGTSTILLFLGIIIIALRTVFYNAIMKSAMTLTPNSETYGMWKTNPVPMSLKIHLFNWTNPEEIYNVTKKPRLKEMGPYTFKEVGQKVNVTWNKNGTVSYWHLKRWWFDQSKSNGSLYDAVTSVNPVALTAVHTTGNWNYVVKRLINIVILSVTTGVSTTHAVGQVLFDGYEDPIINTAKTMSFGSINMPFDKFGWFYQRNGSDTYEGSFNMDTGEYGQIGRLYKWKNMNQTPYYKDHCGEVGGSAGEFFPLDLTKESIIKFFSPDLCRFVELEFVEEVVISGILGYKYAAGPKFLDNGTKVSDNKCFCTSDKCIPNGMLDVSACRYGSPAFVSLPHFYKADPYYSSLVDGLNASSDKHDFYMIFEPKTALPLQVAARLQLNLLMHPVEGFNYFNMVPTIYFPTLWFEQVVDVPSDLILKIKILVNFEMICLGIGIFFIWIAILIKACCCYKICTSSIVHRSVESTQRIDKEESPLKKKAKKSISELATIRTENDPLAVKKDIRDID